MGIVWMLLSPIIDEVSAAADWCRRKIWTLPIIDAAMSFFLVCGRRSLMGMVAIGDDAAVS
ncbi:hypothetical protein ACLOJK_014229 [Asimina triloba]